MTILPGPLLLGLLLLLLAGSGRAQGFSCPDNRQCYCFEESPGEFRVHCAAGNGSSATGFDLTIQRHDRLVVECANAPDWSDFAPGESGIEVGPVKTLVFTSCPPPGREHSQRLARLLGVSGVEQLKFLILNGTLVRDDFAVYPDLKSLILSNNDVGNVSVDLLADLPALRLLELRNTNIQLPDGFFDKSSLLRTLELGSNQLRRLAPGTFNGLVNLELLNLWRNDLRWIEPGTFDGLTKLTSLDLNQNGLTTLPEDIFKDLENLEMINLSSNNFTSLPAGLLRANPKLRVFKLFYNKQNLTELPPGLFANLTDLKTVMITRNGLFQLPENLFGNSAGLRNLTIDRNYLTSLPRKIFQNTTKLYSLSVSSNDLKELPDDIFESTSELHTLDLSKNHLTSINDRMLVGLESLQVLNMENNDLAFIHVDAFGYLKNLKVAKFANNKLTLRTGVYDIFGHISPFHHCHSLEELYLAHNNITEMHSDWVVSNTRLRELDLKYNSFNYLQTEDLQFISDIVHVDLRHNNISRVVLTKLELMSTNQSVGRNVVVEIDDNPMRCDCEVYDLVRYFNGEMHPYAQNYVHLKPGKLSCVTPGYMSGSRVFDLDSRTLRCLVESEQPRPGDPCSPNGGACTCWLRRHDRSLLLDCAGRNLTHAPEWIDARDVSRVELDLGNNLLEEPPSMHKKGYEKVTSVNLSGNRILFIDERLLSPNLKTLLLDGNNLTTIDSKILKRLSNSTQITKLSLKNNPWRCDCESRDLLSYVQANFKDIPDLLDIRCISSNVSLSKLTLDEMCPASSRLYIVVGSLISVFGLLLGLALAMFFRFQRHIKIWLFSKNLCMCLVSEDELDKDKIYDAFISFSHKDEDFVIKELVSKLEDGPRPYKLCIHMRDWLAGEWIPTQIERSVEESRRTIVVLSPNFIESEWGTYEFQVAHKQALKDKRTRVIIILYGEIGPIDNLEPDLKTYLQMNTYVKWGEPWFWQKLKYNLPHSVRDQQTENYRKNENITIVTEQLDQKLKPKSPPENMSSIVSEQVRLELDQKLKQKINGDLRPIMPPDDSFVTVSKRQGIVEVVKEINKSFNDTNFEIRVPQCTTV